MVSQHDPKVQFGKSSYQRGLSSSRKNSGYLQTSSAQDLAKSLTIKSRLTDSVEFPSLSKTDEMIKMIQQQQETTSDQFQDFGDMYQWLKENIYEITPNSEVSHFFIKGILLTEGLSEMYSECESEDAIQLMKSFQTSIKGKKQIKKIY